MRWYTTAVLVLALAFWPAEIASAGNAKTYSVALRSSLIFTGRTGSKPGSSVRAAGRVVAAASWQHHAWYAVAARRTDAQGRYRVKFKPSHRGSYLVRIWTPDGRTTRYLVNVR
jgi:hypothetical protein